MSKPHRILIPFALAAMAFTACTTESEPPVGGDTADVSTPDTASDTGPTDVEFVEDVAADVAADVTQPDVVVTDRGAGLCLGVIDVCLAQCAETACFETCLTTNATTEAEATLASAYVTCTVDGECVPPTATTTENVRAGYDCEQTKCLAERVACEQGEAGTGGCIPVGGCIAECERDDFKCYRECLGAATTEDASAFIQLQYCVSATCYVKDGTPADFDVCLQTAIEEDGPCASLRTACYGDTPGLQGIGIQPMYGSIPANPWP